MDYYKVMLVDDEEEVRQAMVKRINWEEIGFTVVASAENGEDALEQAESLSLDVIMTDIHMPFMDGLELLRRIKEQMPGIKSVIFSGYDEFEYAKEAIKLEAEEYILKPIDANELKAVFVRIKERLDEERSRKRNIEELQKYYRESLPILKEQFVIGLLEERLSEDRIRTYSEEYQLPIESAFYAVSVIQTGNDDNHEVLDRTLLPVSIKQVIDENLQDKLSSITLNYLDTVVVVARLKSTDDHKEFVRLMDRSCKIIKRVLGVNTVAGVGRVYGNIKQVHLSFKEAKDAAAYRIVLDDNQAISIMDVEPNEGINDYVEEKQIHHIIRAIKIGDENGLRQEVSDVIGEIKRNGASPSSLQLFYAELLVELMRLARGHNIPAEDLSIMEIDARSEVASFATMEDFENRLWEICNEMRTLVSRERNDSTKQITDKAKQYIVDHFAESDLSVERLCGYLNISATYFSALFKKETGMSFVSYLTKIRMEQAQHMLDTTDEKSYVIAGKVGYEEPNYFSYVFKKYFGVSPSKYRH